MSRFVVALGDDAEEWSRHDTLDEADSEAEERAGRRKVTVWRAEDYDSQSGQVRPLRTIPSPTARPL